VGRGGIIFGGPIGGKDDEDIALIAVEAAGRAAVTGEAKVAGVALERNTRPRGCHNQAVRCAWL
jgi:hypothetical protein